MAAVIDNDSDNLPAIINRAQHCDFLVNRPGIPDNIGIALAGMAESAALLHLLAAVMPDIADNVPAVDQPDFLQPFFGRYGSIHNPVRQQVQIQLVDFRRHGLPLVAGMAQTVDPAPKFGLDILNFFHLINGQNPIPDTRAG